MGMTPADVRAQQFRIAFRGYDVEQVDAFLDRVAAALSDRTAPAAPPMADPAAGATTDSATGATAVIEHPVDVPARALRVLEAAEHAAEQLVLSARGDADHLLAAARTEAEQLRTSASEEAARIRTQARSEAAETVAETRTRADEVLANARDEAARLEREVTEWHRREIDELDDRRLALTAAVERLEAQERVCRERLQRALQETLRQVTERFAPELVPAQ